MVEKNDTTATDVSPGTEPAATRSLAATAVLDALQTTSGTSVADLAAATGLSRPTVARTLTNLERDGLAVRTRGGYSNGAGRTPDTWRATGHTAAPTTTVPTTTTSATDTTGHADATCDGTGENEAEADAGARTLVEDAAMATAADGTAPEPAAIATDAREVTDGIDGGGLDAAAVSEARDALAALGTAITTALQRLAEGDRAAAMETADAVYGGSARVRRLVRAAACGRPRTASGAPRSAPGQMRAKVIAHLTAHPADAFTPHEIAKVIGHSAGAISNALDRLIEAGQVVLVCERPRRFTAATMTSARGASVPRGAG